MSKYRPLSDRLARHDGREWRASFSEIEEALGFALPKSARESRPWWGNEAGKNRSQARAWTEPGWRVVGVDLLGEAVVFQRDGAPEEVQPAVTVEVAENGSKRQQVQRVVGATALIGGAVAVVTGLGVLAAKALKARRA